MKKEIYEKIENRLEKLMQDCIEKKPFDKARFEVLDAMDTIYYAKLWNLEVEYIHN